MHIRVNLKHLIYIEIDFVTPRYLILRNQRNVTIILRPILQ